MGYLLGLAGFLLFFINDWNDWQLSRRELKFCFPLDFLLLCAGTIRGCRPEYAPIRCLARWGGLIFAALFLALEIYTLFFALSVKDAYTRPGQKRPACQNGVYALCRHPGVLWVAGLYNCLWAAAGMPLLLAQFID